MTPAGYMAKRIARRPGWINADHVLDVFSLSNCVSENFADFTNCWKHNSCWLFDSPQLIRYVAAELGESLEGTALFYYEVCAQEYDDTSGRWKRCEPWYQVRTRVVPPVKSTLEGYDVVSIGPNSTPGCSPLSCNGLAASLPVNSHCLLPSLDETLRHVNSGAFLNSEPGPFQIFAVHSVPWDADDPR